MSDGIDVYRYWRHLRDGNRKAASETLLPTGVGGVDGRPQPGLYRMREGGGWRDGVKRAHVWLPVKIWLIDDAQQPVHTWRDGLALKCLVGRDQEPDPLKVWGWCALNPITQAEYKHWLATGQWQTEVPADCNATEAPRGIGDNSAKADESPDSLPALMRALESQRDAIEGWLAKHPAGETAAHTSANWLDEMRKLEKRVTAAFEAEKEPWLLGGRKVDEAWRPAKRLAAAVKDRIAAAYTAIAAAEKRRKEDLARKEADALAAKLKAEQEAAHAKREAEIAAKGELPLELEPLPPPPVVTPAPVKVSYGGASGRRIGITTDHVADVNDWLALAAALAMNPAVQETMQKEATALARKGVALPGTTIRTIERAA